MKLLLTLNGQIVDEHPDQLSVLDRGFLLGDGIFETFRYYDGVAFRKQEHLERLASSAKWLGITLRMDINELISREVARGTRAGLRDAYFRITLTRSPSLGLCPASSEATVSTILAPLPVVRPNFYSGISVVTARGRRNEFAESAGHKTTAYTDSVLALRYAMEAGADDALFLDTCGHLSEATASNVFICSNGRIFTPPLDCGVLPGITRSVVMDIARESGLEIIDDSPLSPDIMHEASEVFLTGSVRQLVPVVSVDSKAVGSGMPGPVTEKLTARYVELTQCR